MTERRPPDANLERRVPPNDVTAEMAVLGAVLFRNESIDEIRDVLLCDDFYSPAHQRLFDAMCAIVGRREPVDPVTLRTELKARGQLDECGGEPYISRLLDECYTAANIGAYARVVADKAALRRLLGATHEIQGAIFEGQDGDGKPLEANSIIEVCERRFTESLARRQNENWW